MATASPNRRSSDRRSRLDYPRRLFLWLLGYSLLLVGCFVLFQYHREKEFRADLMNSRLQLINTYILTELDEGNDIREISLEDFHPFEGIRVSLIDSHGALVYDSSSDSLPHTSHLDREEIRQAMKYSSGYTLRRHSESTGEYYFYSATQGHDGRIVRTAVPYSISLSSLLRADFNFLWIMGGVSLVMCVLGYFATRRIGVHITRLNRFAENVEKGARISDTQPFPNDELGAISNHIVGLYAKLQQAYSDRDREHRAALREQVEKERIKKQLTNNINHELKTPVAAIRVCLETLLAHGGLDAEKRGKFLRRSLANTERLQRLLADVALITRMDEGGSSIQREETDLSEIIAAVAEDRRLIADAKGIAIETSVQPDLRLQGNRQLLESIFNNLIDNAIAYSGGTRIRIEAEAVDSGIIEINVSDDGSGVPAEHLPRLFERFYRIDKGRSRASGGTGLGLSIVKNAVMMHGGKISVENRPEGGLLFNITFPLRDA